MDVQLELLLHLELRLVVYCLHWKRLHLGKKFQFLSNDSVCLEVCAVMVVCTFVLIICFMYS